MRFGLHLLIAVWRESIAWLRIRRNVRNNIAQFVLVLPLTSVLFIYVTLYVMPRLWIDPLFDRDGVVTRVASVVVEREPPRFGITRGADVLVRYSGGMDLNSPVIEQSMSLNRSAYRALRSLEFSTMTIQYLPYNPMIARPVEVLPDGTLRDLRSWIYLVHPGIFFVISLLMVLGNGFVLSDILLVMFLRVPAARREQIVWRFMAGTLVTLLLLCAFWAEPWNPIPWLDRCHLPMPPFGMPGC